LDIKVTDLYILFVIIDSLVFFFTLRDMWLKTIVRFT